MGKAESYRRSGPQIHHRAVQDFGLVNRLGTISSLPGVRLPRSIGQIPPHDFPKSAIGELKCRDHNFACLSCMDLFP